MFYATRCFRGGSRFFATLWGLSSGRTPVSLLAVVCTPALGLCLLTGGASPRSLLWLLGVGLPRPVESTPRKPLEDETHHHLPVPCTVQGLLGVG